MQAEDFQLAGTGVEQGIARAPNEFPHPTPATDPAHQDARHQHEPGRCAQQHRPFQKLAAGAKPPCQQADNQPHATQHSRRQVDRSLQPQRADPPATKAPTAVLLVRRFEIELDGNRRDGNDHWQPHQQEMRAAPAQCPTPHADGSRCAGEHSTEQQRRSWRVEIHVRFDPQWKLPCSGKDRHYHRQTPHGEAHRNGRAEPSVAKRNEPRHAIGNPTGPTKMGQRKSLQAECTQQQPCGTIPRILPVADSPLHLDQWLEHPLGQPQFPQVCQFIRIVAQPDQRSVRARRIKRETRRARVHEPTDFDLGQRRFMFRVVEHRSPGVDHPPTATEWPLHQCPVCEKWRGFLIKDSVGLHHLG